MAKLKNGETVLDLGCGNATSLIIAASEFGARGIGVERSPFYYLLSKLNVLLHGQRKNIQIIFGDFKKAQKQLNNTDVVYLYLLNSALASIEEWFFANLKKGARVVSLAFSFAKHKPSATDHANNLGKETKIELYL